MKKLLDFLKDLVDAIAPKPDPVAVPVRVKDGRPGGRR
jgi:hypothetical protein